MTSQRKAPSSASRPTSKLSTQGLILGGLTLGIGAAMIGAITYTQSQTSAQMAQVNEGLNALAHAIESQAQQEPASAAPDGEELVGAIEKVMERRAAAERESMRAELMADYTDLPTEVGEDDQWTYGEIDARFTLYTYSDPNCPYCQKFHGTPKQLVDTSQGVLNAQYHHMTIISPNSTTQALASECAGRLGDNQYFWAMNDHIYENPDIQRKGLAEIAQVLGFDKSEFQQCMSSSEVQNHVATLGQQARSEDVTGTPTSFLIDNKTGERVRIAGAQPAGAIVSVLREMIQSQVDGNSEGETQEG